MNKGFFVVGFSLVIETTLAGNGEPFFDTKCQKKCLFMAKDCTIFARKQQHHTDAKITLRESRCQRHHCSPPRHHLDHATTEGVDEAGEKLSSGAKLEAHERLVG